MGVAVSLSRLIYLTSYRHDLEFRIQLINQARMGLLNFVNDLMNVGTDMDPDSPEVKQMEQRKQRNCSNIKPNSRQQRLKYKK